MVDDQQTVVDCVMEHKLVMRRGLGTGGRRRGGICVLDNVGDVAHELVGWVDLWFDEGYVGEYARR